MGKIQECETSFSEITMLMLVASPFPDKPISNQLQKSSFVQDVEDWPDFCCPRWAFLCHGEIGFWQRAWTGRDNELETKQNQVTIRYVLTRQETLPTVISTTCAFAWIQCKHAFASRALFPSSFHPVWFPSNVASKAWQISQKKAGFNGKIICKWTCSIATFDYYRRVRLSFINALPMQVLHLLFEITRKRGAWHPQEMVAWWSAAASKETKPIRLPIILTLITSPCLLVNCLCSLPYQKQHGYGECTIDIHWTFPIEIMVVLRIYVDVYLRVPENPLLHLSPGHAIAAKRHGGLVLLCHGQMVVFLVIKMVI